MKKGIVSIVVVSIFLSYLIAPIEVSAKTLSEFEAEVAKFTAELQAKQNKIAKNDAEVAQITKHISELQAQVKQIENDNTRLQNEIEERNKEIKKKGKESKKIIEYYQLSNGENSYLEYIFGSTSITDMIYRISMVEQLTEYNDKVMKELDALIKKNKTQQTQLGSKKEELGKVQEELKSERERINADTQAVRDTMPSVQEQIKAAKENVAYLKKLGCGKNEDVQSCIYRVNQSSGGASVPSSGSTLRPITNGIRQGGLGSYSGHTGQDMTSPNKKGETIYPIANGYVIYQDHDNCTTGGWCGYGCNGNANMIVIRHNINGRYIYASYLHLSQVYVGAGQQVSAYTPLGKMGNTGCTSGSDEGGTSIHLHLELATCHYYGGGCTYNGYKSQIINPTSYVSFPGRWSNR